MTKKDYELIAQVVRLSYAFDGPSSERLTLAHDFAAELAATNPRFSRDRFIAACMGEDSHDSAGRMVRYSS